MVYLTNQQRPDNFRKFCQLRVAWKFTRLSMGPRPSEANAYRAWPVTPLFCMVFFCRPPLFSPLNPRNSLHTHTIKTGQLILSTLCLHSWTNPPLHPLRIRSLNYRTKLVFSMDGNRGFIGSLEGEDLRYPLPK